MIRAVKDRTRPPDRNTVSGEALSILRCVRDNARVGKSNKLSDLKGTFEGSVSLDFDTYFFFLRKHHYIALDHRDGQLKLTDSGDRIVEGEGLDTFTDEAGVFFGENLQAPAPAGQRTDATVADMPRLRLPEELLVRSQPPPSSPLRKKSLLERSEEPGDPATSAAVPRLDPEPRRDLKGTEVDLRYMKFDSLGSGPMGTVFKGRHSALGLDICIKELKDIFGYFSFLQRGEVLKRLKKELCAQAQVRHPSIVAVLDQNTDVARPYFVLELLHGSLRQKLDVAPGKPLPVPLTLRYFLQATYALRAAHATGLTHHNLKPENLLFDALGNVKVGDFGLSRVIEVDVTKGMPQVFVGTGGMAYLSPELLGRTREAGPPADVYALGILLYEMLTGQVPGRRSPMPSEVNPDVPQGVDALFDRMSHDRLETRYPDFDAVLEEFYRAVPGEYGKNGDLLLWSSVPSSSPP